jgi:hypothetical protein
MEVLEGQRNPPALRIETSKNTKANQKLKKAGIVTAESRGLRERKSWDVTWWPTPSYLARNIENSQGNIHV